MSQVHVHIHVLCLIHKSDWGSIYTTMTNSYEYGDFSIWYNCRLPKRGSVYSRLFYTCISGSWLCMWNVGVAVVANTSSSPQCNVEDVTWYCSTSNMYPFFRVYTSKFTIFQVSIFKVVRQVVRFCGNPHQIPSDTCKWTPCQVRNCAVFCFFLNGIVQTPPDLAWSINIIPCKRHEHTITMQ